MRYSIIDLFASFWTEAKVRVPRGWIILFFALASWLLLMVLVLGAIWLGSLWG